MAQDDVTIRVQALDGHWEMLGVERSTGVWPEDDSLDISSNPWGPDKASFTLKRDPGMIWPDLSTWTPVEIEIGGEPVWDGRILETPGNEADTREINVQCEGWQYHTDDDPFAKLFVHTSMTDWQDINSIPGYLDPTYHAVGGSVTTEQGALSLAWGAGVQITTGTAVGVIYDAGPLNRVKAAFVDLIDAGSPQLTLSQVYIRGMDDWLNPVNTPANTYEDAQVLAQPFTAGTYGGVFTAPRRYVVVLYWYPSTTTTLTTDTFIRLSGARLYGETAYESSGFTNLTASQVVLESLKHSPLLSQATTGISSTGFVIPDLVVDSNAPQTTREVAQAANAFHNYITKIETGTRRLLFKPRPTQPKYEVGAWSGSDFQDASLNSGEDIYSKVMVTGSDEAGASQCIIRQAGEIAGVTVPRLPETVASFANPSADVNATGLLGAGDVNVGVPSNTVTRTTTAGEFDSSPGGYKIAFNGTSGTLFGWQTTLNGTFKAGVTYVVTFRMKLGGTSLSISDPGAEIRFGYTPVTRGASSGGLQNAYAPLSDYGTGNFVGPLGFAYVDNTKFWDFQVAWTPSQDYTVTTTLPSANPGVLLQVRLNGSSLNGDIYYVDSHNLYRTYPTLANRRGFARTKVLPISSPLSSEVGQQIGDTWLAAHMKTPFKGGLAIHGHGAARGSRSGRGVEPYSLLRDTGELLRLSDRVDPDTGGHGRDGLIANVRYTHSTRTAQVDLDSGRGNIEAFLARLAVVSSTRVTGN